MSERCRLPYPHGGSGGPSLVMGPSLIPSSHGCGGVTVPGSARCGSLVTGHGVTHHHHEGDEAVANGVGHSGRRRGAAVPPHSVGEASSHPPCDPTT